MVLPILTGPLRGSRWIAGAAAGEGKGLSVIRNAAEPAQLDMARRLASKDGICFDIGANVGLYTLLFARYSKRVFAFEPLPRNISYLHRMLDVNRIGNATVVPCAVSETTALASLREGENPAVGTLDRAGEQPVAALSCDDFVSTYGVAPALLKIDVEGSEAAVLRGAAGLLTEMKPSILLSTHGDTNRAECLELLKQKGYSRITPLNGNSVEQATEFAIVA